MEDMNMKTNRLEELNEIVGQVYEATDKLYYIVKQLEEAGFKEKAKFLMNHINGIEEWLFTEVER